MIVVAVLPILVAICLAIAKVKPDRVHRFERRYGLMPDDRRQVIRYLDHTRQWRAYGAAVGYTAVLLGTISAQRVLLPVTAAVAGWLGGAVLAEFRYAAVGGGRALPGWLRRVPVVVAGSAAAVTVLVLMFGANGAAFVWGLGALACAAAVALANRQIDSRPLSDAAVDLAISRHSASSIAGVGTALALACLGSVVAALQGVVLFDTTGSAVAFVGTLCALGGVALGWRVAHAERPPVRFVSAFAVLFLIAAASAIGWAQWRDRPPYPASVLHATATIRFTDADAFDHDVRALGVSAFVAYEAAAGQTFVGRLAYRVPSGAKGDYQLVVIDKRQNRVAQHLYGAEGAGWSSTLSALPQRYPWLSAMASQEVDGGFQDAGLALSARAGSPGPMTFTGSFPGAGMVADDLMVVLIFTGPDSQTYWAERVLG
jgi:hypothetical protein